MLPRLNHGKDEFAANHNRINQACARLFTCSS